MRGAVLFVAAATAGAINAVAGGGTLVSFPAALAVGLTPVVANATNAVALTPAAISSSWAYRRELQGRGRELAFLLAPTIVGGLVGAALLLLTPQRLFEAVVPILVLFATGLLIYQNLSPARGERDGSGVSGRPLVAALLQFLVSVYGGYFGAGMGILMLALLPLVVRGDIHRMNAVKLVLGAAANGVASIGFIAAGAVDGAATIVMATAAAAGGFAGAAIGRRIEARKLRWFVVAIGLVLGTRLAYTTWAR
jgi:uncharacterized membrane protein YfcA